MVSEFGEKDRVSVCERLCVGRVCMEAVCRSMLSMVIRVSDSCVLNQYLFFTVESQTERSVSIATPLVGSSHPTRLLQ